MKIIKPHESLDLVAPYLPPDAIIVEAGAFTGSDTLKMARHWPAAQIHAFEPVPQLFSLLQEKTSDYKNIKIYPLGLGTYNGTATLYLAEKPNKITQASSLLAPQERLHDSPIAFTKTIEIPTITLDTWAAEHQIPRIDLLWLDLQGMELVVLQTSPHILKKIKTIHIEVATSERYKGQPLMQEVHDWLVAHNFEILAKDFDEKKRNFGNLIVLNRN
jgi:FkbM family methyltransferase